MLIYSFEKSFLGIDEPTLRVLGFHDLQDLQSETGDFADLFVKTPGFIHNFKHVHWIDFIECAESSDESKVIIRAKSRRFQCTLGLKTIYLAQNPSSKAYIVNLQNLRELDIEETRDNNETPLTKPTQTQEAQKIEKTVVSLHEPIVPASSRITKDPYALELTIDDFDTDDTELEILEDISAKPQAIELDSLHLEESTTTQEIKKVQEIAEDDFNLDLEDLHTEPRQELPQEELVQDNYVYDPSVASSELGLPVDLIEEFIEDFIGQAKEFKHELYTAQSSADLDTIKIQSHKLKGVAANLRIENAFETLTILNSSSDFKEIKNHLDKFYRIINGLSPQGDTTEAAEEEEKLTTKQELPIEDEIVENDLVIDFKEENTKTPEKEPFIDSEEESPKPKQEQKRPVEDLLELNFEDDDLEIEFNKVDLSSDESSIQTAEKIELEDFSLDLFDQELEEEEEEEGKQEEEIEIPNIETPNYNKQSVAQEIGLDMESFNELFQDYIEGCKSSSYEIGKAIEHDDFDGWQTNAVQLKGMSDNMRVSALSEPLKILIETKDKELASKTIDEINSVISNITQIGV